MNAAREIVQEIIGAGGELWIEGDRVRGRNIPRRLAVLVKADEGGILAALLSAPAHDNYAIEERLAIQEDDDLPQDRGFDDIAGFEGLPNLTMPQRREINACVMILPQASSVQVPGANSATRQSAPDMAPPASVTCGACARFQPGDTTLGVGVCTASANGLPPSGGYGYRAAYPMAPRRCAEYQETSA
jgi:hypothetical protein